MSATQTLERNEHTGLSDSTHSSSCSGEKYGLDEFDEKPILLYRYRGRGGLETSSQKDLCAWLDKGEPFKLEPTEEPEIHDRTFAKSILSHNDLYSALLNRCFGLANNSAGANYERHRVTTKPIPRYSSYVEVKRHDLYMPEEKTLYASFANYDSNLASIKVPSLAYWSRLIFGNYHDLYIVSPESSPSSSQADEDSNRTSPTGTWGRETSDEARLGDMQENGNDG